jgi:predicted helicase
MQTWGAGACWSFRHPVETPLRPVAVCPDRKSTARSKNVDEDISADDLALLATTNVAVLESRLTQALGEASAMTVAFATCQSIDVVAQAQKTGGLKPFNLITRGHHDRPSRSCASP